jgi:hypothetical protein
MAKKEEWFKYDIYKAILDAAKRVSVKGVYPYRASNAGGFEVKKARM